MTAFHLWQIPVAVGLVVLALVGIHWLERRNRRLADDEKRRLAEREWRREVQRMRMENEQRKRGAR